MRFSQWPWFAIPFVFVLWLYGWTISEGLGPVKMQHDFGYYNMLTDAFQHHQLSLLIMPSNKLLELSDPYDPAKNTGLYMFDASLFKGKYYLYWGPAPVLLLFWPARLIPFLPYMPESWAIMTFCSMGVIGSVVALLLLAKNLKLEVPSWMASMSVLSLGLGTPALFICRDGAIYHASIACAYMCLMIALPFLIIGAIGDQPKNWGLFLGSLFLGLNACSRVVNVSNAVFLLPFVSWLLLRRNLRIRSLVGSLVYLWVPFIIAMALLGLYNYLRFDSIREFGVRYMMGDFRSADMGMYSLTCLRRGLSAYFLNPVHLSSTFPFLPITIDGVGMIIMCPMIVFLATVPWLKGNTQSTILVLILLALAETSLLSFAFIGHDVRYEFDFAPMFMLAATLSWIALRQQWADRPWAQTLVASAGVLLITYGCFFNFFLSIPSHMNHFRKSNPASYERLQRLFSFHT